MRDPERLFR
jgi:hypothetical protein